MAIPRQRLWIGAGVVVLGVMVLNTEREEPPPCEVSVTVDVLNIRSAPGVDSPIVGQLGAGDVVEARSIIRNGFRQVGEDRWVASQFLAETSGSECD